MFGSTALAENSISDQGIVAFGSGSASANFTKTTATSVTFLGSMSVIGTSSKVIAASGLLLGIVDASADFTQTSTAERLLGIAPICLVTSRRHLQQTLQHPLMLTYLVTLLKHPQARSF